MLNYVFRKITDFMQWIFDGILPTKVKNFIKDLLSETQKRYIKNLFKNAKRQKQLREIEMLRYRLYNLGFTVRAYEELQHLCHYSKDSYMQRLAAWELSLWHANQYSKKDAESCLEYLSKAKEGIRERYLLRRAVILEAESYQMIGEIDRAKQVLINAISADPRPDLFLAAANLETAVLDRLKYINKALEYYGLERICLKEDETLSFYDGINIEQEEANRISMAQDKAKVSVIIPVYNASDVICTSLDSVLAQTWSNLEVLVVDDCSTDDTVAIVEGYVKRDLRVHLIRARDNGGAYVSRNLALQVATGDFVTINDADDWSHPRKIEKQALHLIQYPSVMGNTSQQARATEDLKFYRRGKPGHYIFSNMSSFMFRRKPIVKQLGYWDSVRFGADSEFIKRIKKSFGEKSIVEIQTGPLSFQRQSENSLTGDSSFGFPGFFMGARREYEEAQNYFHYNSESICYDFPQNKRPFAIPEPLLPKRENEISGRRHFDVIIVSDFRLEGGSTMSSLEEIKAQKQLGLRTGLIQLMRYDYSPKKKVNSKIRNIIDGEGVQMVVYGEKVSCAHLIVRYPPILQEWQRFVPDVKADKISVIINQTPMSNYGVGAELRYDFSTCKQRVKDYFGKSGIWYPIGPLVREALYTHHNDELNNISLSNEEWSNIINISDWQRPSRPQTQGVIRIGRHSRAQSVKWPADSEEILSIYPESAEYEVHILGGADVPKHILGYIPSNWSVKEFGEIEPKEFLSTLDVFVYYTHPDWVESFGRVIIEAMAVGVPVVIAPRYRNLFGDAAIYAEPFEVQEKINQLMNDDTYYESQINRAYFYIDKYFGYSKHASRIRVT